MLLIAFNYSAAQIIALVITGAINQSLRIQNIVFIWNNKRKGISTPHLIYL